MSIPDRFYRIAKHKLGEIKDWFDKVDEEEDFEAELQRRRADPRLDAQREAERHADPVGEREWGNASRFWFAVVHSGEHPPFAAGDCAWLTAHVYCACLWKRPAPPKHGRWNREHAAG